MFRPILFKFAFSGLLLAALSAGCSPFSAEPRPGPDKQGSGMIYGAAAGAGSGAVTGAQLASGAGPGAWIGAGFGAVFGALSGLGVDVLEEDQMQSAEELQCLREQAWATDMLEEHYRRRLALHPSREIFPADLFFAGDQTELSAHSKALVRELAKLSRGRMPTSRVQIVAYVTASDAQSDFAKHLSGKRAEELALEFVRSGMEARRVTARGVVIREPLVLDPYDSPGRYRQAIELVYPDR